MPDNLDPKHLHQKYCNLVALYDPNPGDYWHEMFNPILVVVGVTDTHVYYLDQKTLGSNRWTWDVDNLQSYTREEFYKKMLYRSMHNTWSDVERRRHRWVLAHVEVPMIEMETADV